VPDKLTAPILEGRHGVVTCLDDDAFVNDTLSCNDPVARVFAQRVVIQALYTTPLRGSLDGFIVTGVNTMLGQHTYIRVRGYPLNWIFGPCACLLTGDCGAYHTLFVVIVAAVVGIILYHYYLGT